MMRYPRETVTLRVKNLSRSNASKLRRVLVQFLKDSNLHSWSVGGRPMGPRPKFKPGPVKIKSVVPHAKAHAHSAKLLADIARLTNHHHPIITMTGFAGDPS